MIITGLKLKNWRNFKSIEVSLRERMYIIGPNASGKSNLLDVFRFLRDVAKPSGGGLQAAIESRGGLKRLRCLQARNDPEVMIEITLSHSSDSAEEWLYRVGFKGEGSGLQRPVITQEVVIHKGVSVISRPNKEDKTDKERLTQTFLQQINSNSSFREIANFFQDVTYLHLVPQLLKYGERIGGNRLEDDPFGQGFLDRLAETPEKTRNSRLGKIEEAMRAAVPQLKELSFETDKYGKNHLKALYEHWRPKAGWQEESQFSDGTLRLIALFWSLLDGKSLLLLEEPELSLNDAIAEKIHGLINRIQRKNKRQVFISTHSEALLNHEGIDGQEILRLEPAKDGTRVVGVTEEDRIQLEAGLSVADVLLRKTRPENIDQMRLL